MLIGERSRQFGRLGLGVLLATQLISAAVAEPAQSATSPEAMVAADDSHGQHQPAKRGTLNAVGDRMTLTHSPATGRTVQSSVSRVSLPLLFEINEGQHEQGVRVVGRTSNYTVALSDDAMTLLVREPKEARTERARAKQVSRRTESPPKSDSSHKKEEALELAALTKLERERVDVVRLELVGANSNPRAVGEERSSALANYIHLSDATRNRHGVSQYRRVRLLDVLPGIDKVVYGNQGRVEFDWVVRPGADPRRIVQRFKGVRSAQVDADGDLKITTANAALKLKAPIAFQGSGAARTPVAARYVLRGDLLGFEVGAFDPSKELIIDPVVEFAAQLGEREVQVAATPSGKAYVLTTGCSSSTQLSVAPFPLGFFSFCPGASLIRLNQSGTEAEFVTNFVDADLNAVVSDTAGRPVVAGEIQTARTVDQFGQLYEGKYAAIVMRLLPDGSAPEFTTRIDEVRGPVSLAFGPQGDIYAASRFNVIERPPEEPLRVSYRLPAFDDFLGDRSSSSGLFAARLRAADGILVKRILVGAPMTESGGLFGQILLTIDSSSNVYLGWNASVPSDQFPSVNPIVVPEPPADPGSVRSQAWLPGRAEYNRARGFLAKMANATPAALGYMVPAYGSRTADGVQDPQAGLQPQVITALKVDSAGRLGNLCKTRPRAAHSAR